jgi:hypothetical protein
MYWAFLPHAGISLALDICRIAEEKVQRGDDSCRLRWRSRELDRRTGNGGMRIRVSIARLSAHTE